jgi:hypothetical protein
MSKDYTSLCNEILKRIPREATGSPLFGMSVEESNAVHRASAYFKQLTNGIEEVDAKPTQRSLEVICNEIQKLVPVIEPENATAAFITFYSDPARANEKDNWGRVYNAFNKNIETVLDGKLTYAKEVPSERVNLPGSIANQVAAKELAIAMKTVLDEEAKLELAIAMKTALEEEAKLELATRDLAIAMKTALEEESTIN